MPTALQIQRAREEQLRQAQAQVQQYFPTGVSSRPQSTPMPYTDAPYGPMPAFDMSPVTNALTSAGNAVGGAVGSAASAGAGLFDFLKPEGETKQAAERLARAQTAYDHAVVVASDQTKSPKERLAAAAARDLAKEQIDGNLLTIRAMGRKQKEDAQEKTMAKAGLVSAPKAGGPAARGIDFGGSSPTPTAAPAGPGPAQPSTNTVPPEVLFAQLLGGPVTVTRGLSTPEHNKAVGGVTGSDHTRTQANGDPMAWDIVPPKGTTTKAAALALAKAGYGTIDEGDHVHVSVNPTQVARGALQGDSAHGFIQLAPQVAVGDAMNAAPYSAPNPMMLAGLIPNPRMVPKINLPDAPQEELPSAMPALSMMDKSLLDPIASAIMPKVRDGKEDTWDRFRGWLQGAGAGAASADPSQGLGQFILRAGTGASAGFTKEKDEQKKEIERYDESVRQAKLTLAKMGFDIDSQNFSTGNANLDRAWKSAENTRSVKASNAKAVFDNKTREILANAGITADNIKSLNVTDEKRATVAIQGITGLAAGQNEANRTQTNLNVLGENRELAADKISAKAGNASDKMLIDNGFDPKDAKNPLIPVAKQTAAAVSAKNPAAAMASLGKELVLSGHAGEILGDKDSKAVSRMLQQKNVEGAAQIVGAALTANMSTNPEAVLKLIDELAALGLPSATLISKGRVRAPVQTQ